MMPRFESMSKSQLKRLTKKERDEMRAEAKAWGYGDEIIPDSSDEEEILRAPSTDEQCLVVLRKEVEIRTGPEYIGISKAAIDNNQLHPEALDALTQKMAMLASGYGDGEKELNQYRSIVKNMDTETRSEIFFLCANDIHFRPGIKPLGKSIVTDIYNYQSLKVTTFINQPLEKSGYFIIAAPST